MQNKSKTPRQQLISAFNLVGKVLPAARRQASTMTAHDTFKDLQQKDHASAFRLKVGFILVERHLQQADYNLDDDAPYKDVLGLENGRNEYMELKASLIGDKALSPQIQP